MDQILIQLLGTAPSAGAVILVVIVFLKSNAQMNDQNNNLHKEHAESLKLLNKEMSETLRAMNAESAKVIQECTRVIGGNNEVLRNVIESQKPKPTPTKKG